MLAPLFCPLGRGGDTGPKGPGDVPNNAFGWGRINALQAVEESARLADIPWVNVAPPEGTIAPGATAHYTLEVVNASNVAATLTLTRTAVGWPTTLDSASLYVASNGQREIAVAVTAPADAAPGATDTATIRATVQDVDQDVVLTTHIPRSIIYLPLVKRN